MMNILVAGLIALVIGFVIGWYSAHQEIAKECLRLGGFYVDKKTFKCIEVTSTVMSDHAESLDVPSNPTPSVEKD